VVVFGAIWFLSQLLAPYKLGVVSKMLAVASIASMIGWPLYYLAEGLHRRSGKLPKMEGHRVAITTAVVLLCVLAFFLLPLPISRVRQSALVQLRPEAAQKIYVPLSATLERLHVRDGQVVREGDILAEFRSLEAENDLEEARGQFFNRTVQLGALRQQVAETFDPQERARLDTALSQADGERKVYAKQIEVLEKKMRTLVLRAPRAGVVLGAPRREDIGKRWERDQELPVCAIGDPTRLRVLVPVTPADFRVLQEDLHADGGLEATVRVHGLGGDTWTGKVAPLPESEAREVPVALTTHAGGPLPAKAGTRGHTWVPVSQHYLVAVDLLRAEHAGIWPGTQAQAKIHCRWRTAAWWTWRAISSTFDLGLA
jgi:putative peptide zinc metalloprotease protein